MFAVWVGNTISKFVPVENVVKILGYAAMCSEGYDTPVYIVSVRIDGKEQSVFTFGFEFIQHIFNNKGEML